jgi:hypothetical protein
MDGTSHRHPPPADEVRGGHDADDAHVEVKDRHRSPRLVDTASTAAAGAASTGTVIASTPASRPTGASGPGDREFVQAWSLQRAEEGAVVVDHRRTGQAERAQRGQGPPRRSGGGKDEPGCSALAGAVPPELVRSRSTGSGEADEHAVPAEGEHGGSRLPGIGRG